MRSFLSFSLLFVSVVALHAETIVSAFSNGEGVNGRVLAIAVLPNGKVVVGGEFASVNGQPRQNIALLNPDGSLDPSFATSTGINGPVFALLALPDGALIVGGDFSSAGNLVRSDLVRFRADGTPDADFGASEGGVATNGAISALALQADGMLIIGGNFTTVFGQPRRSVARLDAMGNVSADGTAQVTGAVQAISILPTGAVLVGGSFVSPNQTARSLALLGK